MNLRRKSLMGNSDLQDFVQFIRRLGLVKISSAILILIFISVFQATAQPVEPRHSVYTFLKRMEVRHELRGLHLNSLPLTRQEIIKALLALTEAQMTTWEFQQLKKYREEFIAGLREQTSALVYKKEQKELFAEASYYTLLHYQDSLPDPQMFAYGYLSAEVLGQFNPNWHFTASGAIAQERNSLQRFNENYTAVRGLPYNTPDKADNPQTSYSYATFDGFRAVISTAMDNLYFDFGQDWNQWGPGTWQHASLSQNSYFWVQDSLHFDTLLTYSNANSHQYRRGYRLPGENAPMPQFRAVTDWNFFRYTKTYARRTGLDFDTVSYLTGHRLEVEWKNLRFGLYEILIYTRKDIEWSYAIPFVPLFVAEHLLGDKDNTSLGIDIQYIFVNRFKLYGELFFDDLVSPLSVFKNNWSNKYALTIGGKTYDALLTNSSFTMEYARVEPWVFTHHQPLASPNNQMQNFGALLGSRLPPNSDAFRMEWHKWMLPGLEFTLGYQLYRHSFYARGSSILENHYPDESVKKKFLDGTVDKRNDFSGSLGYHWKRYAEIHGGLTYQLTSDWRSQPGVKKNNLAVSSWWSIKY